MSLVWAIPVVAAAVAAGLVAAHARPLEDAGRQLAASVARLTELRWQFASLRAAARETDARVAAFRERHPVEPPAGATDPDGGPAGGPPSDGP